VTIFRFDLLSGFDAPKARSHCASVVFGLTLLPMLLLTSGAVHAARPMITDDARIVDDKACQLESWTRHNRDSDEYWALPACNFTGNLELAVGAGHTRVPNGRSTTETVFQGKTLFRQLETDSWSWGLAVGGARHDGNGQGRIGNDYYAYVPATFAFRDDHVFLHANLGWSRDGETRKQRATWGVGSELQLTQSTWLIGETFSQQSGRPFYQVGVRRWLVQDRVQIDATYGNRLGSESQERWFSIGLRLLSLPFLP